MDDPEGAGDVLQPGEEGEREGMNEEFSGAVEMVRRKFLDDPALRERFEKKEVEATLEEKCSKFCWGRSISVKINNNGGYR